MSKKHTIKCSNCQRELKIPNDPDHIIFNLKCPACGEIMDMDYEHQDDTHPTHRPIKKKIKILLTVCLLAIGAFACLYILNNFIFSTGFKKEKDRLNRDTETIVDTKVPTPDTTASAGGQKPAMSDDDKAISPH